MLEVFAVNVCVPTKEGDFYNKVAINEYPIIIFGRQTELMNVLKSNKVRDWLQSHIRTADIYDAAVFNIVKTLRDNTTKKTQLLCKEVCGEIF